MIPWYYNFTIKTYSAQFREQLCLVSLEAAQYTFLLIKSKLWITAMTHCCGSFCLIGWHAMTLHDNDELSTYVSCCPLSSTSMCSSSVSSTSSSSTSGSSTTCCIMKSMPASNFWRKEMHTKQIYTDCNRYKCHTRCHTAGEDSVSV